MWFGVVEPPLCDSGLLETRLGVALWAYSVIELMDVCIMGSMVKVI
jgi:hypothetical protein